MASPSETTSTESLPTEYLAPCSYCNAATADWRQTTCCDISICPACLERHRMTERLYARPLCELCGGEIWPSRSELGEQDPRDMPNGHSHHRRDHDDDGNAQLRSSSDEVSRTSTPDFIAARTSQPAAQQTPVEVLGALTEVLDGQAMSDEDKISLARQLVPHQRRDTNALSSRRRIMDRNEALERAEGGLLRWYRDKMHHLRTVMNFVREHNEADQEVVERGRGRAS